MASVFILVLFGVAAVQGFPTLVSRDAITALTTAQVNDYSPYTYFSKAAYCDPSKTLSWTCGAPCTNINGFKPVASGGDGSDIQYWYVGYDPNHSTVVVAHQGTNTSHIKAILTDADLTKGALDSSLFPGLSPHIEVHNGFQKEQAKTASIILSSVQTAMTKYQAHSVTMVGHSLGAALALLDSVYLLLHLPQGTSFKTVVYGLPRVGNQPFADYVDANLHVTHINNRKDPIPIVPGMFLGYVHPSGEIHIRDTGEWAVCPGQDNGDKECIVGDVSSIFFSHEADHDGPYNGIMMHCS